MKKSYFNYFAVDRLGKGILSKILFCLIVFFFTSAYLLNVGDRDFRRYFEFLYDFVENFPKEPARFINIQLTDLPLSKGNLVFLGYSLLMGYLSLVSCIIYMGAYIRFLRKDVYPSMKIKNDTLTPISTSKLSLRIILASILALPISLFVSFFALYLFIIFIIIIPFVFMTYAIYLSGDKGFFEGFILGFQELRGHIIRFIGRISIFLAISVVPEWIMSFVNAPDFVVLIVTAFVRTYCLLGTTRAIVTTRSEILLAKLYMDKNKPLEG